LALLYVFILALVQGITEFLPVSSSGHLVLAWTAFDQAGWQVGETDDAERLIVDIALHLGTLLAVMLFFWRDVARMALGVARLTVGRRDEGARLAYLLIVASLPIAVAGFLAKDLVAGALRDPAIIAWTTLGFGLLLYVADRFGMTLRRLEHLATVSALILGCAQVLALIPGTSRSGITITAARFLGFERDQAAQISLLMAIPAILGAALLAGLDLHRLGRLELTAHAGLAAVLAFVAALGAIAAMMAWLRRATYTPFVVYRIALGLALLWLIHRDAVGGWLGF